MGLFPMFLKLSGRRCLVVGAGRIAQGKSESLLASGAHVTVIAPEARPNIVALSRQGKLEWFPRPFEPGDLQGAFLVIAGTNNAEVNHAVYRQAAERGILCNVVDDPAFCDFYFPSVVTRGDLKIAVSTAGASPAFAQRLRQELEEQLPADLGPWLASLGSLRREVLAAYPPGEARKGLLHALAHREVCDAKTCPARVAAAHPLSEKVIL
jgi:precorrin-2 dehydrogenase/sirohydrochlorin ferrochelatase